MRRGKNHKANFLLRLVSSFTGRIEMGWEIPGPYVGYCQVEHSFLHSTQRVRMKSIIIFHPNSDKAAACFDDAPRMIGSVTKRPIQQYLRKIKTYMSRICGLRSGLKDAFSPFRFLNAPDQDWTQVYNHLYSCLDPVTCRQLIPPGVIAAMLFPDSVVGKNSATGEPDPETMRLVNQLSNNNLGVLAKQAIMVIPRTPVT